MSIGSFLSDLANQFSGKKQQNIANAADTKATGQLGTGYNLGKTDLANTRSDVLGSNNYGDAINTVKWGGEANAANIRGGYGDARTATSGGYTGARTALDRGYGDATGNINTSADKSIDYSRNYLDQAMGILNPGITSGNANRSLADSFNGVNGLDAQAAAYKQFADANNPLTAYRDQITTDNMNRTATAQGRSLGGSGRTGTEVARASLQQKAADLAAQRGWIDRSVQEGNSMAQFGAGITNETGGRIAGTEERRGTNQAGLDQWRANQAGQYAIGEGHDIAGLNTGEATAQGNNIWNTARGVADLTARGVDARTSALMNLGMAGTALDTGYYNTLAGNAINKGNADAANSGTLLNNIGRLGGFAVQGFTPAPVPTQNGQPMQTQSPFGNMWNGLSSAGSAAWNGLSSAGSGIGSFFL